MNQQEEWRVIARCPRYEVSSHGKVRRVGSFRILAGCVDTHGYPTVQLYPGDGTRINILVHNLVATAFLGDRPEGLVANHKNRNKRDNRVENLEWITQKENTIRGETTSWSRVNEQVVKVFRHMAAKHPRYGLHSLLARLHGVDTETVRAIIVGRNWKEV